MYKIQSFYLNSLVKLAKCFPLRPMSGYSAQFIGVDLKIQQDLYCFILYHLWGYFPIWRSFFWPLVGLQLQPLLQSSFHVYDSPSMMVPLLSSYLRCLLSSFLGSMLQIYFWIFALSSRMKALKRSHLQTPSFHLAYILIGLELD